MIKIIQHAVARLSCARRRYLQFASFRFLIHVQRYLLLRYRHALWTLIVSCPSCMHKGACCTSHDPFQSRRSKQQPMQWVDVFAINATASAARENGRFKMSACSLLPSSYPPPPLLQGSLAANRRKMQIHDSYIVCPKHACSGCCDCRRSDYKVSVKTPIIVSSVLLINSTNDWLVCFQFTLNVAACGTS